MLHDLQNKVLKREGIEYVLDEFGAHVKDAFANLSKPDSSDARAQTEIRRGAMVAGVDCG